MNLYPNTNLITFVIFIFSLFSFFNNRAGAWLYIPYHLFTSTLEVCWDRRTKTHSTDIKCKKLIYRCDNETPQLFCLFPSRQYTLHRQLYYMVRLGHILNIYLRNLKKKWKNYKKRVRIFVRQDHRDWGDLQRRMDYSLEEETSSNITPH